MISQRRGWEKRMSDGLACKSSYIPLSYIPLSYLSLCRNDS